MGFRSVLCQSHYCEKQSFKLIFMYDKSVETEQNTRRHHIKPSRNYSKDYYKQSQPKNEPNPPKSSKATFD